MSNHVFQLPSGVECEVKEFTAKHQRMLTEKSGKLNHEAINEVLADVIVRVGTLTKIDTDLVEQLLSCDRKKILFETRQFSLDFEPRIDFTYTYNNAKGDSVDHPLSIEFEAFGVKPLMVFNEAGELVPAAYSEYSQVVKEHEVTLPKSGKKVLFRLLDGVGEKHLSLIKKTELSSHTPLKVRNPRELKEKPDGGFIPVQLNLDNLSIKDIEYLRKYIKDIEGQVDSEVRFEHPEAQTLAPAERYVTIDLLQTVAFFFPSEAI